MSRSDVSGSQDSDATCASVLRTAGYRLVLMDNGVQLNTTYRSVRQLYDQSDEDGWYKRSNQDVWGPLTTSKAHIKFSEHYRPLLSKVADVEYAERDTAMMMLLRMPYAWSNICQICRLNRNAWVGDDFLTLTCSRTSPFTTDSVAATIYSGRMMTCLECRLDHL